MPIGIISLEDYQREVPSESNHIPNNPARPAAPQIIEDKQKGRNGATQVPESIRALAAQDALIGVPAKQIAQDYNISESSVSAYKNGSTSTTTYRDPNKCLKNKNSIFRDRIVRKAGRLSLTALNSIDEADFESASLRDKAAIAKDMASIVRDMTPDNDTKQDGPQVQILIHAPQMRKESDYIEGIVSLD